MTEVDRVLELIDHAVDDCSVSGDAMRWTPEPPERPKYATGGVIHDGGWLWRMGYRAGDRPSVDDPGWNRIEYPPLPTLASSTRSFPDLAAGMRVEIRFPDGSNLHGVVAGDGVIVTGGYRPPLDRQGDLPSP